MSMKNQIYNVPLIPPDLRREETIKQIADSLEHLEKISTDVFNRISNRVSENKSRLSNISERAAIAQAKIDKLKGSNKATKVFCSPKYPHADDLNCYDSIFAANDVLLEIERNSQKITAKHQHLDDKILKEKLHFYNLHWNFSKMRTNKTSEEGLGRLPSNLKSVSSLLLFNTAENPYQKYVMLDPLRTISKTKKTSDTDADEGIGAAPHSIAQGEQLERQIGDNFFYQPGLGHVPEIDVPVDLPYLPGIADDLEYVGDIGPTIAPSVPIVNLPALPEFTPDSPLPPTTFTFENAPPPLPPASAPLPPPPPAPPAIVPNLSAAPPPPPPPPPVEEVDSALPVADTQTKIPVAPKEVSNTGDARSNLLESIRQAGGKTKLKKVENRKIEVKKKKQEAQDSGGVTAAAGGDLMSDLFNKLAMRRKGISGAAARTESVGSDGTAIPPVGSGSMMDHVSAMIPPPPKPVSADETSDSDWD